MKAVNKNKGLDFAPLKEVEFSPLSEASCCLPGLLLVMGYINTNKSIGVAVGGHDPKSSWTGGMWKAAGGIF